MNCENNYISCFEIIKLLIIVIFCYNVKWIFQGCFSPWISFVLLILPPKFSLMLSYQECERNQFWWRKRFLYFCCYVLQHSGIKLYKNCLTHSLRQLCSIMSTCFSISTCSLMWINLNLLYNHIQSDPMPVRVFYKAWIWRVKVLFAIAILKVPILTLNRNENANIFHVWRLPWLRTRQSKFVKISD